MANLLAKAIDGEDGIHLGAVRPSMIQNELLLKAPMGTAKRRGHPLPQGDRLDICVHTADDSQELCHWYHVPSWLMGHSSKMMPVACCCTTPETRLMQKKNMHS